MNSDNEWSLNRIALGVFAPILILVGVLGFVIPTNVGMTSGATPYNVFHLIFGVLGIFLVLSKSESLIRAFCIGFGAIDLYQAVASYLHLFPEQYLHWTRVDDVLHIVVGLALVLIGIAPGLRAQRQAS
ncbi:MAG: hypothetical protein ABI882_16515 [Acidobacteriota bacterium]